MAKGDRVRLSGLEKTPLLNGELGTVAGCKGQRVVVVLDSTGAVRKYNTRQQSLMHTIVLIKQ